MNILIGGAWPYANGSLHLGHVAALLPGDILARYYRLKGERVLYVSGSDCNGTPISIRANQENTTVTAIADRYHTEFLQCFNELGFTYDLYTRTDASHHHIAVQNIFLKLIENGFLFKKRIEQAYCTVDHQFLPDRYVEGTCPNCGAKARGDQCDNCSTILDPLDLKDKTCKICGNEPEIRETEHYYYEFSHFQQQLENFVNEASIEGRWRENAVQLTKRYLTEGLPDRAVTRDLPNGISVPVDGFEGKKIYVWIEAVAGYYTASLEWAKQNGKDVSEWWNEEAVSYYIHGKDNIPFHTVIWPAILMGFGQEGLPTHIVSNEYLTLEKRKLSTSQNWAVWVPEILKDYDPDSIRYFLTINAPENRDADFSWREFIYSHNSELLGAFANFVNRTLKFIAKSFNHKVPQAKVNISIKLDVEHLYAKVGEHIESGEMKQAIEAIFNFIRTSNRYFDEEQPWATVNNQIEKCEETLATCVYIIQNLAQLLHPFLPFGCEKIRQMLGTSLNGWDEVADLPTELNNVEPLYERIDVKKIEEELQKLNEASKEFKY
ncbi:Methionine--tRNA ligase [Solibacillus isronensis B3W22]|uniref:Methionine--tRNA ligase n=1 Tax=Solibacillus isronensis B3W22 TaxID=1224748 RepID=K1L155_9BACL|nr:methionine--tRNA ligase [Solibacillus isronensis]AMO85511.1 methionine--tRNA ligase [Solibacillus silvestris]EKB44408.1 Methionine--tRNA ligase [Solibacillus isronensis B3W22]